MKKFIDQTVERGVEQDAEAKKNREIMLQIEQASSIDENSDENSNQ